MARPWPLVVAACLGAVAAAVVPAAAQPAPEPPEEAPPSSLSEQADMHNRRAAELYAKGDFAGAATEFEAALRLDPRPEFLFGRAQMERLAGNCEVAVTYYRRFLATGPVEAWVKLADEGLEKCGAEPGVPEPEPAPVPEPTPPEPVLPPPPPPPPPPSPSPWYTDGLGGALAGVGTAGILAGGAMYLVARSKIGDADGASSYEEASALVAGARQWRTAGVVSAGVGALVLGGAAVRYTMVRRRGHATASEVAWVPLPGGGAIAWSGSF